MPFCSRSIYLRCIHRTIMAFFALAAVETTSPLLVLAQTDLAPQFTMLEAWVQSVNNAMAEKDATSAVPLWRQIQIVAEPTLIRSIRRHTIADTDEVCADLTATTSSVEQVLRTVMRQLGIAQHIAPNLVSGAAQELVRHILAADPSSDRRRFAFCESVALLESNAEQPAYWQAFYLRVQPIRTGKSILFHVKTRW